MTPTIRTTSPQQHIDGHGHDRGESPILDLSPSSERREQFTNTIRKRVFWSLYPDGKD